MTRDHVVLVGAMGSGKTTIGEQLAEALNRPFLDSDDQLEATYGTTGRQLAERMGVAWLHDAEASVFRAALESKNPAVIAGAASIADRPELVARLESSFVVFLDAEPDVLATRMALGNHRRSVDWDDMSRRLRGRGARLATVADVVISTGSVDPASAVADVLSVLATRR